MNLAEIRLVMEILALLVGTVVLSVMLPYVLGNIKRNRREAVEPIKKARLIERIAYEVGDAELRKCLIG